MRDPEVLLIAAINRISARITEKLTNSAEEFSEIAEEIPQKLQKEWSIFKEEVIEESDRLTRKKNSSNQQDSNQKSTKED